jgi:hypothetical protein
LEVVGVSQRQTRVIQIDLSAISPKRQISLNEQATDPKSHTLVRITYTPSSPVVSPAIPMVDPDVLTSYHEIADH